MSELNSTALDRFITGNYGEDQFEGDFEDELDAWCDSMTFDLVFEVMGWSPIKAIQYSISEDINSTSIGAWIDDVIQHNEQKFRSYYKNLRGE